MIRLVLLAATLATAGCGLFFDGAYLLTGNQREERVTEREPTGQTESYLAADLDALGEQLRCGTHTRAIERRAEVTKHYRYRRGWPGVHAAAAVIEGVAIGIAGAIVVSKCTGDGADVNCSLLYWTLPFLADALYSTIRIFTIKPPKLVGKDRSEGSLARGDEDLAFVAEPCPPGATIILDGPAQNPGQARCEVASDGRPLDPNCPRAFSRSHPGGQVGADVGGAAGWSVSPPRAIPPLPVM